MYSFFLTVTENPFKAFGQGLCTFLNALFGLALLISLTICIVKAVGGDEDGTKKMIKWIILASVGMIVMSIVSEL